RYSGEGGGRVRGAGARRLRELGGSWVDEGRRRVRLGAPADLPGGRRGRDPHLHEPPAARRPLDVRPLLAAPRRAPDPPGAPPPASPSPTPSPRVPGPSPRPGALRKRHRTVH